MAEAQGNLKRSIGLTGAVALVVGAVIGAGVYTIIKQIALLSGNALWLAFSTAMLVSLIGVIPLIQLAGAIPRAGAGYLFGSRMLSPYLGFLTSHWVFLGGASSSCLVSITLAEYVAPLLPAGMPYTVIALAIVGIFYLIYQFGMQLALGLQVILAAQFVFVLLLYAAAGLAHIGVPEMAVVPPNGGVPFFMAVILCYTTCMGFQVVAELGEEIQDARRNIPFALLIGGALVAVIYVGVGTVFVSLAPSGEAAYDAIEQPLTTTAAAFLPPWLVTFLGIGAYGAALTSLNAAAIALPRELYAQARDGLLPAAFGKIDPRTHIPKHAVTAYFVFVLLLLLLPGGSADFFGVMTAIGILAMSAMIGLASLRLRVKFPEWLAAAYIRFPHPLLVACTVITVLASIGLSVLVLTEVPRVSLYYTLWTVVVSGYYFYRRRSLGPADWARIAEIPGENEAE